MVADCPYSHTGEGLHRFVDPADDRVYLYTQFEVPDARRVFTTFEQPDLKAVFTFTVTAPRTGRSSPTPRPRARSPSGDGVSAVAVPARPSGCRRTSPRSSPASTTRSTTPTSASTARSRSGTTAASRWSPYFDVDELVEVTKQGFEFFEDAFDFPYPFGKYDQLYVPEFNMGAMENAGCVTLRDEYLPRSRQATLVLRAARQHGPARDGAHVVRRPGDHEVVGRPVAQRVVRRVGLAPRVGRRPRSTTRRGPGSPTPARTGRTARTSCPRRTRSPPTTTTSRPSR